MNQEGIKRIRQRLIKHGWGKHVLDRALSEEECRITARAMMDKHALHSWRFTINRRRRSTLGRCIYHTRTIEISAAFIHTNHSTVILDTILHEIAHAIAGRAAGHGVEWKRVCREIGAEATRCGDALVVKPPSGMWVAKCNECGRQYNRTRMPKGISSCKCQKHLPWPETRHDEGGEVKQLLVWKRDVPATPRPRVAAQSSTSADTSSEVQRLLNTLSETTRPKEKRRIRARLRRLGHRGGLSNG